MTTQTIICPSCNTTISLDEALTSTIKDDLEKKFLREKEHAVQQLRKELEGKSLQQQRYLEDELKNAQEKQRQADERELALRKAKSELEEKQRNIELELARRLDEERNRTREAIEKELTERQRLKDQEKEKVIADLRKSLEDAQRKASQGSQQTQGEAQEIALEDLLRRSFPHDDILPVGKGVNGADIRHVVKSSGGTVCGTILWESKQTKSWSSGWVQKLKTDLRAEQADIPALVSSAPPEHPWSGISQVEGVWVCSFGLVLPLATLLRKTLIDVGYQKAIAKHQGQKADQIYAYITGTGFRQQVEALVDVFSQMQQQIFKERMAYEKSWKMREMQVQQLYLATAAIYGSVQGIAGASAVPQISGLELPELEETTQA